MPELPEVEAARQLLHDHCRGKKVEEAICADDEKVIQGIAPAELAKALKGRVVKDALRKGKNMWLELDEGPALMFHLGMTGSLVVKGIARVQYVNAAAATDEWPPKYWKVQLELEGGVQAAFCDPRRFGRVKQSADVAAELAHLGFDPLLSMPPAADLAERLSKERRAIKALLLDQRRANSPALLKRLVPVARQAFSAGVGNWVADEVLYQARIHPEQKANSLGAEQAAALHAQLQGVLQVAVAAGADSDKYPPGWLFHQKWSAGKQKGPAPTLDGHRIETTAFVPDLQRLPEGAQSAAAKQAASKEGKASAAAEPADDGAEAMPAKQPAKKAAKKAGKAGAEAEAAEGGAAAEPAEDGAEAKPAKAAKQAAKKAGKAGAAAEPADDGASAKPAKGGAKAKPARARAAAPKRKRRKAAAEEDEDEEEADEADADAADKEEDREADQEADEAEDAVVKEEQKEKVADARHKAAPAKKKGRSKRK